MLDRADDERRQSVRSGYSRSGATRFVSLMTNLRSRKEHIVTLYVGLGEERRGQRYIRDEHRKKCRRGLLFVPMTHDLIPLNNGMEMATMTYASADPYHAKR